jgi:hypothetical protein
MWMAKYIVQLRRGTAEQWATHDTMIPLEGELVLELDNESYQHKLKIGDGIHTYAQLAYLTAGNETVTQALTRTISVTLYADRWEEITCATDPNLGYYKQALEIDGIAANSKVDLQPTADMLAIFQSKDLAFVTETIIENDVPIIVCYSIGMTPLNDYTMQATVTEVEIDGERIVGNTVSTTMLLSDWNETDEKSSAYIKNKPFYIEYSAQGEEIIHKLDAKYLPPEVVLLTNSSEKIHLIKEIHSPKVWELDYGIYKVKDSLFYTEEDIIFFSTGILYVLQEEQIKNGKRRFILLYDGGKACTGVVSAGRVNTGTEIETLVSCMEFKYLPTVTTEINEDSTDDNYPTAKAVIDYVDKVIGVIENGSY